MTDQAEPKLTAEEASRIIIADIHAYPKDGVDKLYNHLRRFGRLVSADEIEALWEERYAELRRMGIRRPSVWHEGRCYPAEVWDEHRRKLRAKGGDSFSGAGTQPREESEQKDTPHENGGDGGEERVRFHKSDEAKAEKPPTIEEREKAFNELAGLFKTDPIAYAGKVKEWAKKLCTTGGAINSAVKLIRKDRADDDEQSQTTKLIAIGVSKRVVLWHGTDALGYATVHAQEGGHWENYRLGHTAFDRWLITEYGRQHQVQVGGTSVPQAPSSSAVRDAIRSLEGLARQGFERQTAMRVGGTRDVIWIDLGRPDWKVIKITGEGWEVVPGHKADVSFIRNDQCLPLPLPVRGGSIHSLREVMNVRDTQFILAVAWLLQALCPVGPYPNANVQGESGVGKSTTCENLLRFIDPSITGLRRIQRPSDLLISARNNWTVGFDNLSYMSVDMADIFCTLATGISLCTRAHYTNDEEHVFTVNRPAVFNGIPIDLAERTDLASRAIALEIPPITTRLSEEELEKKFLEIWPGALGALLDGLVAAIAGRHEVRVNDPARMIDFERWAEAGCRGMGFAEWEFVKAYAANRRGLLVIAAEANAVARAIVLALRENPKGFEGSMTQLYSALDEYKERVNAGRTWPKNPIKLSNQLRVSAKALATIGVRCLTDIDNRSNGGVQHEVIIERGDGWVDE
jgi:hypothetical protein